MPDYNPSQQFGQPQSPYGAPIFMPQSNQYNPTPQARLRQMEEQNYYNQSYRQPQSIPPNPIIWVNGIEGAKAYIMPPNCTILLMDSEDSKFYLKKADPSGICDVFAFKFEEVVTAPILPTPTLDNTQFVKKEDFDKLKSEFDGAMAMVNSFLVPNNNISESAKVENSRRTAIAATLDKKEEKVNA